jgi:hypothetical protein
MTANSDDPTCMESLVKQLASEMLAAGADLSGGDEIAIMEFRRRVARACNGPAELCEAFDVANEVIGRLGLRAEQE